MSQSTAQSRALAAAPPRMLGIDVARALAILGMIIVNFRAMLVPDPALTPWLERGIDHFEGKAAALFVVLAGVGISLRTFRVGRRQRALRLAQSALLRRAALLFVIGLVNLHMWTWDILHCYGLYLAAAVFFLDVKDRWLWVGFVTVIAASVAVRGWIDYDEIALIWDTPGAVVNVSFNGLFPVFPWFAFLLLGMWLGRLDLRSSVVRNSLLLISFSLLFVSELSEYFAHYHPLLFGADETAAELFRTWPRPPTVPFVIAGCALSIIVICGCIGLTEPRPDQKWVVALSATGQLAFTTYIAHAIVIQIPLYHGVLEDGPTWTVLAFSLGFYGACVAASVWWRRRWPYGPLETVLRNVSGEGTHAGPAPVALMERARSSR